MIIQLNFVSVSVQQNEDFFRSCADIACIGETILLRGVNISVLTNVENAFTKIINFSYKVWSVTPRSEHQGNLLKQYEDHESVDFWEQISRNGKSSRIMAAPDTQIEFENFLKENHIDYELIIENVERF